MADEAQYHHENKADEPGESAAPVESTDRGLFDFGNKKDEETVIASEFSEKVQVKEEEEKKHEKLHRTGSSSSSVSIRSDHRFPSKPTACFLLIFVPVGRIILQSCASYFN